MIELQKGIMLVYEAIDAGEAVRMLQLSGFAFWQVDVGTVGGRRPYTNRIFRR